MKLSPLVVTPEQNRHTTPDVFITDQYGKLPDLHGDGELTINQAIRLSKIVNGFVPAFATDNNRLISGFLISRSEVKLVGEDLHINIPMGVGIIDKIVFKIPTTLTTTWKNFKNQIPPGMSSGRILIYFAHKDTMQNALDRPYPQNHPRHPTIELPENQVGYDPIRICRAFYDPETQKIVNSEWDKDETKVLISGSIKFEVGSNEDGSSNGDLNLWVDEDDRSSIIIDTGEILQDGMSVTEEMIQQGGGFYDLSVIDGGHLDAVFEHDKKPSGIVVLLKQVSTGHNTVFQLSEVPKDINALYVFFNGILYRRGVDWVYDSVNNVIEFKNGVIASGGVIYVFENVSISDYGYMRSLYFSDVQEVSNAIPVVGLTEKSKYMIFIDGLHIRETDILNVDDKNIYMNYNLKVGSWVNVTEIVTGKKSPRKIELLYRGPARDSAVMTIYGINGDRTLLVFYNGVLYLENYDYRLTLNTISFNQLPLSSKNEIIILGV